MKAVVYLGIALRIIALFATGMVVAYINPSLHEFLGDTPVTYNEEKYDSIIDGYRWGAAHYWYFWMCVFLFLLSLVNVVVSVRSLILKHHGDAFKQ